MNQIKQVADTFGVDWSHLIAQVISFVIVCALLYFFAYKRVLAILEARRVRITEGLANAEKIKLELGRTEAQRAEVLAQANEQAARFIEEARRAAARLREEETQKAIAATEQIIAHARRAAEAPQDKGAGSAGGRSAMHLIFSSGKRLRSLLSVKRLRFLRGQC